ncbi:MAG: glycosyltransferase family 4 protein [Ktedonobacteraceae bacterium]
MHNQPKRLKIALLTALTLQDKLSSWRITNGYFAQALEKYCGDITHVEPVHLRMVLAGKVIKKGLKIMTGKSFMYYHSLFLARQYAKVMTERLAGQSFDLILAPACAPEIAFLKTDIPMVLIEDATFDNLYNYYPQYSNLFQRSYYEGDMLEGLGIQRASLALYPSQWAADSALHHYHATPEKVHVVSFGTNFDSPPPKEISLKRKKSDRCRLFFIGVDWLRKGGEIAFETLLALEELGIEAELIICGVVPPPQFSHKRMTVIPYLNRKDEQQRRQMEHLFETSDFLFLPTRGEAYGMVFCEASSYGLPSITTDTGGVGGAVTDGENGFKLPFNAKGAAYAELIARIYRDDQRYTELVQSSRAAFENRLNWDAWGISATRLIHEMLERQHIRKTIGIPAETASFV